MLARDGILVVDFETRGVSQPKQNRLIKAVWLALHEEHDQGRAQLSVDNVLFAIPFLSFL